MPAYVAGQKERGNQIKSTKKRKRVILDGGDTPVEVKDGDKPQDKPFSSSFANNAGQGDSKAEGQPPAKKKQKRRKKKTDKEGKEGEESKRDSRFICFVGNLPYTATKVDLAKFFGGEDKVVAVRLQTHKDTNKSKGCGFVEFTNIESLRRALQLHGFPMGKKGRKINVELSAGGGGNSKQRLQKIKTKRDKLGKERSKTHEKSKVSRENERQKKAAKLSAQKKKESNASANGGPSSSSSSSSSSSVTAAAPVPGGSFGAAKAQQ